MATETETRPAYWEVVAVRRASEAATSLAATAQWEDVLTALAGLIPLIKSAEQAVIAARDPEPDWRARVLDAIPYDAPRVSIHFSALGAKVGGKDHRFDLWPILTELTSEGLIKDKGPGRNYVRVVGK